MGDIHDGKIDQLSALEPDWDSYGAKPITDATRRVLHGIHVVPTISGGVQIEVYANGWGTEVEFSAEGEPIGVSMEREDDRG